eukprot:2631022-Prymnesium_polylepis.1
MITHPRQRPTQDCDWMIFPSPKSQPEVPVPRKSVQRPQQRSKRAEWLWRDWERLGRGVQVVWRRGHALPAGRAQVLDLVLWQHIVEEGVVGRRVVALRLPALRVARVHVPAVALARSVAREVLRLDAFRRDAQKRCELPGSVAVGRARLTHGAFPPGGSPS